MKKLLITLPCFNEGEILEKNTLAILDYANRELSGYDWTIVIVDNASTDKTFDIATDLRRRHPRILVDRFMERGRGAALKSIWQAHKGHDIYAYMDIDLATDLASFADLVRHVDDGYHLSVGSRYVPGARSQRSMKRKVMSHVYNVLLRTFLGVRFKDAQCGFKAFDRAAIDTILPDTYDTGWFWDTAGGARRAPRQSLRAVRSHHGDRAVCPTRPASHGPPVRIATPAASSGFSITDRPTAARRPSDAPKRRSPRSCPCTGRSMPAG